MKKIVVIICMICLIFSFAGCSNSKSIASSASHTENMKVQLTNDHFMFITCDKDKKCLNDLSSSLEDNYSRITKDLGTNISEKIIIYVYPDLATLHREINQPDAPEWVVGTQFGNNCIKMVSPLNPGTSHTYSDMMKVAIHEFTHVVISHVNSNISEIPIWMNEGVAEFEAKQIGSGSKETMQNIVNKKGMPSISDFEGKDSYSFGNNGGYLFSYTIIEYIVNDFGRDKLNELIKFPYYFEKILGMSKSDFQTKWKDYFYKNYINK